jgi:hypothetical protein
VGTGGDGARGARQGTSTGSAACLPWRSDQGERRCRYEPYDRPPPNLFHATRATNANGRGESGHVIYPEDGTPGRGAR